MTILVGAGDSFTHGNDLKDHKWVSVTSNRSFSTRTLGYSRNTWAAKLADHFGLDYVCTAQPGCSNQTIVRNTIVMIQEILDSGEKPLVAVMWTYPYRMDIIPKDQDFMTLSQFHGLSFEDRFSTKHGWKLSENFKEFKYRQEYNMLETTGIRELGRIYYTMLDDDMFMIETLKSQLLLKLFLEKNNIKYLFTWACNNCIADKMPIRNDDVNLLRSMISDANWVTDINLGFVEWSGGRKYPIGQTLHPLEEAHLAYAQEIIIPQFTSIVNA